MRISLYMIGLLGFLCSYTLAQVPEINWAERFGGAGVNNYSNVATDGSGNCILAGNFEGTVSFGSYTLTSEGEEDIFLAKLNLAEVRRSRNLILPF